MCAPFYFIAISIGGCRGGSLCPPVKTAKIGENKRDGVLGCRLGLRFCFAEVSTGHPRPSPYKNNLFSAKLTGGRRDPPLQQENKDIAKPTGCQGCHPLQKNIDCRNFGKGGKRENQRFLIYKNIMILEKYYFLAKNP